MINNLGTLGAPGIDLSSNAAQKAKRRKIISTYSSCIFGLCLGWLLPKWLKILCHVSLNLTQDVNYQVPIYSN